MRFSTEVEQVDGHFSGWDFTIVFIVMVASAILLIWSASLFILHGAGMFYFWFALAMFFVTPYAFTAGNRETYLPGLGRVLKNTFWFAVMLICCTVAAYAILAIKPWLLSLL